MHGEALMAHRSSWPTDWRRVALSDVGKWLSGGTPSTSNDAYWDGDIPWISAASLKTFRLAESDRRVTALGAENGSRLVGAGTVLFVVRGMSLKSEFRIGVTQRTVAFGQDCKAVLPAEDIDPYFLAYAIQTKTPEILAMVEETSHGTGRLDTIRLQELEIGVPPLPEQRRIVAACEAIERRIAAIKRVRAKLAVLRRTVVDDLVTGPPLALGTLLEHRPRNGFSPLEVPEWTGLLTLGLGCLTTDGFRPRQMKRIPDSDSARRFLLADGDLLMSRANTRELVGLVGMYRDVGYPCIYPDLMMRLRPDPGKCLPEYLALVLSTPSVRRAIQAGARGTSESMVKISAEFAESLDVPLPSVEAQRRAVLAVAAVDSRIAQQGAVIDKLRLVQRAVTEDLLVGKAGVDVLRHTVRQRSVPPSVTVLTPERNAANAAGLRPSPLSEG
ncbi:restriction endonuclease subunit S [Streptantibioticus ferralitis]|uniref:Restriction endonuclease subunit S n=1 Tax=Streptantibioticus ferralitis TaxID=236510 RepID=A0ABT5Z242_9ACTN|nr:restriction endonuclease subunit S [Streptantibioticus ferralitis]MDF2257641.1 restriction endonuclease subunit S [Streptantibioticus ferralitis]